MTKPEANRQNSLQSTGPKTPAGKVKSSKNSEKHGAYSEALFMLLESPEDFEKLRSGLDESLLPLGPIEVAMVDRMASLWWRMERTKLAANQSLWMRAKRETLTAPLSFGKADDLMAIEADECRIKGAWSYDTQERLLRHELTLERSFFKTLHELERLQARRMGQAVPPVISLDVNLSRDGD